MKPSQLTTGQALCIHSKDGVIEFYHDGAQLLVLAKNSYGQPGDGTGLPVLHADIDCDPKLIPALADVIYNHHDANIGNANRVTITLWPNGTKERILIAESPR